MTEQVNVQDAKTRLSEILSRVEQGEEIVIARSGTPIARLSAVGERPRRDFGFTPAFALSDSFYFDPLPNDELTLWEGK